MKDQRRPYLPQKLKEKQEKLGDQVRHGVFPPKPSFKTNNSLWESRKPYFFLFKRKLIRRKRMINPIISRAKTTRFFPVIKGLFPSDSRKRPNEIATKAPRALPSKERSIEIKMFMFYRSVHDKCAFFSPAFIGCRAVHFSPSHQGDRIRTYGPLYPKQMRWPDCATPRLTPRSI